MTEPVARYSPDPCEHGDLTKDPAGAFVAATDYDALLAERDAIDAALAQTRALAEKEHGKLAKALRDLLLGISVHNDRLTPGMLAAKIEGPVINAARAALAPANGACPTCRRAVNVLCSNAYHVTATACNGEGGQ